MREQFGGMDLTNKKVLVLGAGISGCSTAWLLKRLGADVTLVEKEEKCGGIGKTHFLDGSPYELGPHVFHAKEKHTIAFYKNMALDLLNFMPKCLPMIPWRH